MGTPASSIDIGGIAKNAQAFRDAGLRLLPETLRPGPSMYAPSNVCAAFCAELWLKALYCQEQPQGTVLPTHRLHKLFDKLSCALRNEVAAEFCAGNTQLCRDILKSHADAFVAWRYFHEKPGSMLWVSTPQLVEFSDACAAVFARRT